LSSRALRKRPIHAVSERPHSAVNGDVMRLHAYPEIGRRIKLFQYTAMRLNGITIDAAGLTCRVPLTKINSMVSAS
jgi:hypothetical protein